MIKFTSLTQVISFLKSVIHSGETLSPEDHEAINALLAVQRGVISQDLTRDIWNCHNDIRKGHDLVKYLQTDLPRPARPDTPQDFKPGLELWQRNESPGSHSRLTDVPADISLDVCAAVHRRSCGPVKRIDVTGRR